MNILQFTFEPYNESYGTKDMEKAIHEAGGTKIKTTYYPGLGHSIWTQAFSENGLIEWLLSQSKANG